MTHSLELRAVRPWVRAALYLLVMLLVVACVGERSVDRPRLAVDGAASVPERVAVADAPSAAAVDMIREADCADWSLAFDAAIEAERARDEAAPLRASAGAAVREGRALRLTTA
ncbi:MAG TPA: hypothetical protein PKE51_05910, partial [Gemmatimonadaceae bacterium]|nr:hypothetical protein [Gemmatimonadaceae bacterium]